MGEGLDGWEELLRLAEAGEAGRSVLFLAWYLFAKARYLARHSAQRM